jgi:hypothetical protein
MNRQHALRSHTTASGIHSPSVMPVHGGAVFLQRQCACGGSAGVSGECEECRQKRLSGQPKGMQAKLAINQPGDRWEQEADRAADDVLAVRPLAPAQPAAEPIHRAEMSPSMMEAPASVQEVLTSPGQPLDAITQTLMSGRFGYDFSSVRIHSDRRAAESARDVNALAYTVGRDVVFAPGQYTPHTQPGQRLLAHELAHVVQQGGAPAGGALQRQPRRAAPVDADAQRIIDLAQDTSRPMSERAVAVVRAIIDQYFSSDASKISAITYGTSRHTGLDTTYVGRGASTTGSIDVADEFVTNTVQRHFARRVLQVRHEIEHVEQVRSGMAGRSRSDERELIAFYHEALATELTGTGRMQHGSRVRLIDAALGYYYCLSSELQSANESRRDELVTRRAEAVRRSGHSDLGEAPTSCRRSSG